MLANLSIVIPSHNRPDLLRSCLESVIRHAPCDTEIVVVDDGSPHASIAAVAESFAGVRTIRLTERQGFCEAANTGIHASNHSIVELLNDDTEVTEGWAEAALTRFEDPAVASVAPLVLQNKYQPRRAGGVSPLFGKEQGADIPRSPDIIDSAGDRYHIAGIARKRGHGRRLDASRLRRGRVFGASASSAFYRRDVLLSVGAFPVGFGAYFEDVDLAFRINRAGYQVVFEPEARVYHRGGASHRVARRLLEQQSRNEEMVFWRNMPAPILARAVPLHLAALCGKAVLRWNEGSLLPFLFGRLKVLSALPSLLEHRRKLRLLGEPEDLRQWGVDIGLSPSLDP